MTLEFVQAIFIDRTVTLTEDEVLERSGLSALELQALADSGVLAPTAAAGRVVYSIDCLAVARTASRLRDELALEDTHALAVVLRLMQRVSELEATLTRITAQRRR
jgi:hypothetical protein